MGELQDVAQQLLAILRAPVVNRGDLTQAGDRLFALARGADRDELTRAVRLLATAFTGMSDGRGASLAFACAGLVQSGADPLLVAQPTIVLSSNALSAATPFIEACLVAAGLAGKDTQGSELDEASVKAAIEKYGRKVGERMPDNEEAWWAVDALSRATMVLLCRSKEARKLARADGALLPSVQNYPVHSGLIGGMQVMLQILDDEELIVLHPELKRGYRIRISGIVSNFQLHTLLEDAVIGDQAEGWLPGRRPNPEAVAVARDTPTGRDRPPSVEGVFNLVNWHGLLSDKAVSTGHSRAESEHWIWNEGVPADIDPFEGTRVVLLDPPPYLRSWSNGRGSPFPRAELEVLTQMPATEAQDWLTRIAAAVGRRAHSETGGE